MRALTTREMLDIWERGEAAGAVRRSLELIATADGLALDEAMTLGIGARNARLLDLREAMFGPRLESTAECPDCGEAVEFAFETGDLRIGAAHEGDTFELAVEQWRFALRLPVCADLVDLPSGIDAARQALFRRCIVSADGPHSPALWPPSVLAAAADAIAMRDPQAQMDIDLTCAACGRRRLVAFNIAQFLWAEIADAGRRLIDEVAILARAFGWNEAETLALPPARRRRYLEAALS
jgi:hypothetical protein